MNPKTIKSAKRWLFVILFSTACTRAIMLGDLWMIIVSAVTIPALLALDVLENRSAK